MPRAIVCVTNDLSTDNRVHRSCMVLQELGYEVLLVGRRLKHSAAIDRPYGTMRFRLIWNKGPMFYVEYSLRLFILLLFSRSTVLLANDLDTLLPAYLVARIRRKKLVYDTHEFFTEVPELMGRPAVRRIWLTIEQWIFPKLQHVITVNKSIARAYGQRYGREPEVVRNIPMPKDLGPKPTREALELPSDRFILVLQGSGINVQRGGEEAVMAMRDLPGALLLLIGGGDAWPILEQMVVEQDLQDRVRLLPRMPYEEMMKYTRNADLGFSLDKDTNLNYRYSLPNKLFDYFRAHIPVLVSDLPEVAGIVRKYDAGVVLSEVAPSSITTAVVGLMNDPVRYARLREKATFAATALDGVEERDALKTLFEGLG